MGNKEFPVVITIRQITKGYRYEGDIKIGSAEKLKYELHLNINLGELGSVKLPTITAEVRRLLDIKLKKEEAEIELTNEEYQLFFSLLIPTAKDFFHNKFIQAVNNSWIIAWARYFSHFDIEQEWKKTCEFSPGNCRLLRAKKFGRFLPR